MASEQECIKKYAEGLASVYNEISRVYKTKTFDELIHSSTRQSVERDLLLIGDDVLAKQKLENLKKYFDAYSILEDRFDIQRQQNAQTQLNSIKENSTLVTKLNKSIEEYELSNTALKKAIYKIMEIDRNFVADKYEDIQKTKRKDILDELSSYSYNYRFNFREYPYLSKIILDIMDIKQENPDTNIDYFLSKL